MKLFDKTWKIVLLLLPFCEPRSFLYFPIIDNIYLVSKGISIACLILYIFNQKQLNISKCLLALILYRLALLIPTIKNDLELGTWMSTTFIIIIFVFIIENGIQNNAKNTLRALIILFGAQVLINLITWNIPFGYAQDGSTIHFVGMRTRIPDIAMPLIAISMVYAEFTKSKLLKSTIFIIGICVISFYIEWIGTAILGICIFFILMLCTYKKKLSKFINYRFLSISALAINIGIIFFKIQNYFSFIIEKILDKKISLTGRTYVWDKAIQIIGEHPIIGHGLSGNGSFVNFYGTMLQGHNQLVQTLYEGGIIATIFLILALIYCGKKLMKYRENPMAVIITNMLFTIFVMMIAERYANYVYFYSLVIIAANIDYIITEKEKNQERQNDTKNE